MRTPSCESSGGAAEWPSPPCLAELPHLAGRLSSGLPPCRSEEAPVRQQGDQLLAWGWQRTDGPSTWRTEGAEGSPRLFLLLTGPEGHGKREGVFSISVSICPIGG